MKLDLITPSEANNGHPIIAVLDNHGKSVARYTFKSGDTLTDGILVTVQFSGPEGHIPSGKVSHLMVSGVYEFGWWVAQGQVCDQYGEALPDGGYYTVTHESAWQVIAYVVKQYILDIA